MLPLINFLLFLAIHGDGREPTAAVSGATAATAFDVTVAPVTTSA